MPSTSCAYHSGKVSLSPAVTRIPYGSTEFNKSTAKSAVSVWPAREADVQFAKSGTNAKTSTGAARTQLRRVGKARFSGPTCAGSDLITTAIVSHTNTNPSAAHTLQAEK